MGLQKRVSSVLAHLCLICDFNFVVEESKEEENSGVECPGESLEPYVGSAMTFEDHEFFNEIVLIEI